MDTISPPGKSMNNDPRRHIGKLAIQLHSEAWNSFMKDSLVVCNVNHDDYFHRADEAYRLEVINPFNVIFKFIPLKWIQDEDEFFVYWRRE